MVIDFNRLNNAASPANGGRAGNAQASGRNEAVSNAPQNALQVADEQASAAKTGESVRPINKRKSNKNGHSQHVASGH